MKILRSKIKASYPGLILLIGLLLITLGNSHKTISRGEINITTIATIKYTKYILERQVYFISHTFFNSRNDINIQDNIISVVIEKDFIEKTFNKHVCDFILDIDSLKRDEDIFNLYYQTSYYDELIQKHKDILQTCNGDEIYDVPTSLIYLDQYACYLMSNIDFLKKNEELFNMYYQSNNDEYMKKYDEILQNYKTNNVCDPCSYNNSHNGII